MNQAALFKIIDRDPERCNQWIIDNHSGEVGFFGAAFIGLERAGELIACVAYDRYLNDSVCMHIYKLPAAALIREYIWFIF